MNTNPARDPHYADDLAVLRRVAYSVADQHAATRGDDKCPCETCAVARREGWTGVEDDERELLDDDDSIYGSEGDLESGLREAIERGDAEDKRAKGGE